VKGHALCAAATASLLALAACADIGSPTRGDLYEFRQILGPGDTISFHWPEDRMPLKFWAKDTLNLPLHVDSAIAVWQRQFLYHEFTGERVQDSADADVIATIGFPPGGGGILFGAADACQAATDIQLDPETRVLTPPLHIYIAPRFLSDLPETQACFNIVAIHELGHALGILRHSSNPLDIMFSNPTVPLPSERDRNTVQVMYHWPMNVTVQP
jgi:predicted Zn-dependent protease